MHANTRSIILNSVFVKASEAKYQIDITHSKIHANIRSIILNSVFAKASQPNHQIHIAHSKIHKQNTCQHQINYTKQRYAKASQEKHQIDITHSKIHANIRSIPLNKAWHKEKKQSQVTKQYSTQVPA